jgi:hypothetical protein
MMIERRDPRCRRASWSTLILGLCMPLSVTASLSAQTPSTACQAKDQSDTLTIHGFSFRVYGGEEKTCLKVFHAGKQVFRTDQVGGTFTLGKIGNASSPGGVVPGTDVTGRGHPNVLVSYFSGGAHCCFELLLFEFEPQFKLLANIGLGDADGSVFKRDTHHPEDKRYRLDTADETFAYWHTSFAESPLIPVLLEPMDDGKGGVRFQLAVDKMRKPAPTEEQWRRTDLRKARAAFAPEAAFEKYYAGSDLWRVMLNRVYAGQDAWAWKTVDAAWPEKKPGKEPFLKDFCQTLPLEPLLDRPAACDHQRSAGLRTGLQPAAEEEGNVVSTPVR